LGYIFGESSSQDTATISPNPANNPPAVATTGTTTTPATATTPAVTPQPKPERKPEPKLSVKFNGEIDPTLYSVRYKEKIVIKFTATNTGEADLDNFRIVFENKKFLESLEIVNVMGGQQDGTAFVFGRLDKEETRAYNIEAYPKTPGSFESEVYPKNSATWLKANDKDEEITLVAKMYIIH
jgi:hypothetical protein